MLIGKFLRVLQNEEEYKCLNDLDLARIRHPS